MLEGRLPWGGGAGEGWDRKYLGRLLYRQKGSLFVSEARLSVFASKGAVVSKRALARARRVHSLAGGAPYLLRRAPSWAKRTFFVPKGCFCRREGRRICLEWRSHVREGHPFVTEDAFDSGMVVVSALKGAVTVKNDGGALSCQKGASTCERASHLLERAPSWAKRALFVPEGRPRWYDIRNICLEAPDMDVKCAFSCQKGLPFWLLAGGRRAYLLMMSSRVKRAPFRVRMTPLLAGGAPYMF